MMKFLIRGATPLLLAAFTAIATPAMAADSKVVLSGSQEVPLVTTRATGAGTITVGDDKSVKGSVTTKGMVGTMAHIHEAGPGKNGPVAIPLMKGGNNEWKVPDGARFTDAQYESYKAGNTYVNVHSDAHPNGEIRGQIQP
jgi:hypothetical protein